MSKTLKILVVRFSSIGDIVLTTPVLRSLKHLPNTQVHFLTKHRYHSILANNPNVDKVFYLGDSLYQVIKDLKQEKYDYIIDLHNNFRSFSLILLGATIRRYSKSNFKKFIYMKFGINFLNNTHVVDRYMDTIKFLGATNDNQGLDYYIDPKVDVDFNIDQRFVAWSIGASQNQKKLSVSQVSDVVSKMDLPIVLLGGENEREDGEKIINESNRDNIFNFCGRLTLDESAYIIKHCLFLLSNDTGLMHIGAALQKNLISFWGCTKPDMGFSPYLSNEKSIKIISSKSKRQCSKHGNSCRFTNDGCIKLIDAKEIHDAIEKVSS